jgi:hypothetical protein
LHKEKSGLHSDSICFNREAVTYRSGEFSVLWVSVLLLTPAIGDIQDLKCTADLQRVRAVIIMIYINLPPNLY